MGTAKINALLSPKHSVVSQMIIRKHYYWLAYNCPAYDQIFTMYQQFNVYAQVFPICGGVARKRATKTFSQNNF